VPYHEYDVDEEKGGQDPGGEQDCEYDAITIWRFSWRQHRSQGVRNSRKLCNTMSTTSMRRMAVRTLAASTMAS
jgi:hypothetical protein